jgi:trehalose 6-phosphate phosphatase
MTPELSPSDALFLDFDGTLVEIAATPALVRVGPELPGLLNSVLDRQGGALAIVSGREIGDLSRLLAPYAGPIAGIHGLEFRRADGTVARPEPSPFLAQARAMARDFAAKTPGVEIEDKGLGLSLHFRKDPSKAAACIGLAGEIARLSGRRLEVTRGKMVVEVHPVGTSKRRAILDFMAEAPFRGRRPIYVGDDRPDEPGFVVVNELGGTTIRVGTSTSTAARFRLPSVPAVIDWLERSATAPARRSRRASR